MDAKAGREGKHLNEMVKERALSVINIKGHTLRILHNNSTTFYNNFISTLSEKYELSPKFAS